MGIEDLDLDVQEQTDRILLVANDPEIVTTVERLLDTQGHNWTSVTELEQLQSVSESEPYDLVILNFHEELNSLPEIISGLRMAPRLMGAAVIVLHEDDKVSSIIETSSLDTKSVEHVKRPVSEANLLLRLSTLLRLRKMRSDQVQLESRVFSQNAQLRDLTNRFKHELKEARAIQQSLMPTALPHDPRYLLAATYIPLEAVGGDFYDIWQMEEEMIGLFIADVAGHGLPAAFVSAMTRMALSHVTSTIPAEMIRELNEDLSEHMPEGRFVTATIATYDAATGHFRMARAGSPPAMIWRAEQNKVESVVPDGFPLGITTGLDFEPYDTTLAVGDRMLTFTDGIIETTDMNGKMIGPEGVSDVLEEHSLAKKNVVEIVRETLKFQHTFSAGRLLKDDVTLIGLERVAEDE